MLLKNDNVMITEVKILQQVYRLKRKNLNQYLLAKLNLNARHPPTLPRYSGVNFLERS